MGRSATNALTLLTLVAAGATAAAAQPPTQDLGRADAVFPSEFGRVSGLLELADGRLLVSDPLGEALMIVDLTAGTADTIGSVGAGPEEYRQPDALFPLPGDSVLLTDLGNGRLVVMDPNRQFVETMTMTRPIGPPAAPPRTPPPGAAGRERRVVRAGPGAGGGVAFVIPQAVDAQGRLYFRIMAMGRIGLDSGEVGRWDRAADRVDTVATIKLESLRRQTSGTANDQRVSVSPVPLSPRDDWAVAPDGRVAVVRSGDYHVDWIDDGGRVTSGPPISYRPVKVGRDEKQRWLDRGSGGIAIGVTMENGRQRTTFGRGRGRGNRSMNQYEWPDVLPPFIAGRARVAPDGMLWVERYVAAGEGTEFDLFDGQGRHVRSVAAPPGRRLVGFGRNAVYLVSSDEFDLEYLERYQLASR